jgi:predicted metal-binding membrane protein
MRQLIVGTILSADCTPAGPLPEPLSSVSTLLAAPAERRFIATAALLLAATVLLTALWCAPMASMPAMAMPGDWTMSMTWMRMPGQAWLAAGADFVGMWSVMMVAMMLPSLLPMLLRYRQRAGVRGPRCERLTATVAAGYFLVWILLGAVVFGLGVPLAAAEMQSAALARAAPLAASLVVLAAGALQLTPWKVRALECCQMGGSGAVRFPCALRYGLQLGMRCSASCAGPTAVLLVLGIMDLHVMAAVTALTTVERLAPRGARVARVGGVALIGVGLYLLVRALRAA